MCQPEFVTEDVVVVGEAGERRPLRVPNGRVVVVEPPHEHASIGVPHGREELGEEPTGDGCPIAVVPAVQSVCGSVDGDFEPRDTARTKREERSAALMHGAVEQPDIHVTQSIAVRPQISSQMGRAGFFFPLEEEHDVGARLDSVFVECGKHGKQGADRCLVITSGTREHAPFRADRLPVTVALPL